MKRHYLVGFEPPEDTRHVKLKAVALHDIESARVLARVAASESPGTRVAIYTALEVYGADLPDAHPISAPYDEKE
jgi:hypothetical protein